MFTGIVRELGRVDDVERNEAGARLRISGAGRLEARDGRLGLGRGRVPHGRRARRERV